MATIRRLAPIFPAQDLAESLTHYRRLGFLTSECAGRGYGFAFRDGVEIHLGVPPEADVPGLAVRGDRAGNSLNEPDADGVMFATA